MSSRPNFLKTLALLAATALPAALTGCGLGTAADSAAPSATGLSGISHGGPNGDAFATVRLYATATAAYGTAGTLLATTTTDQFGFFKFGAAATCTSGQQAYVTVSGGNTGANTNNPNVLLLAALGPCSGISAATSIYVNELTTVAAGYSLSSFIGISGTTVNISAPATNNAATPACTGSGATLSCTASGLAHAFLNAANLVSASTNSGAAPTGQAYTTVPGNANSTVPTLLLNTLGDALQSCVNSTGGVAGDSPATPCGTLFTNTTPPTTSVAAPVVPTNTLQAVLNLAKYPTMIPAQVTALFNLASPYSYFTPALGTAPADFSLAIAYKGPVPTAAFYGFFTVADITDSTYTIAETGNGTGTVTVSALTSNGTQSYQGPTVTNALCTAGSPCAAGVDTTGHIWLANTASTNLNVYELKTADGSLVNTFALPTGTAPNSAVVDKFNDVFVTSANITTNDLFEYTTATSAFAPLSAAGNPETQSTASPEYIAVDQAGSLWNTNYNSASLTTTYNQNTAAAGSAPTFGNAYVNQTLVNAGPGVPYTIMIDGAGNGWVNNTLTLLKVAPGASGPSNTYTISYTPPGGTAVAASSARFSTLDGDGNIFLPDNSKNILWQFFPGTATFVYLTPCTGNTGTACITAGQRLAASRNALTDATGSIWISNPSATVGNGNVLQVIGTAAPTWPQLSYQKPGVRP